jgi:hypothetical protein
MMTRFFYGSNKLGALNLFKQKMKFKKEAHREFDGLGDIMVKDLQFNERTHYGAIDHENNSVIPDESYIVNVDQARVFDFVADAISIMRLNYVAALQKGLVNTAESALGDLLPLKAYENPRIKYDRYLSGLLRFFNNNYISNNNIIITSHEDYVNHFFRFIFDASGDQPISMTRWNTSSFSNILDTGLAFRFSMIKYDHDNTKIRRIIDHNCYSYFKNLCLNTGFSILRDNPNLLLFDLMSPATEPFRVNKGLFNLNDIFNKRFIKTYTIDMYYLLNNINIYYNKLVNKIMYSERIKTKCGKTYVEIFELQPVDINYRPYNDEWEIARYIEIRNFEEGYPFDKQKTKLIYKKAKTFIKQLDKMSAMSYINDMFRDQVWNKDFGYHDSLQRLRGKTTQTSGGRLRGEGAPTGDSGPSTSGGGGSGY